MENEVPTKASSDSEYEKQEILNVPNNNNNEPEDKGIVTAKYNHLSHFGILFVSNYLLAQGHFANSFAKLNGVY